METNPGSVAVFEETEDSRLGQLFIAFQASINSWISMRNGPSVVQAVDTIKHMDGDAHPIGKP